MVIAVLNIASMLSSQFLYLFLIAVRSEKPVSAMLLYILVGIGLFLLKFGYPKDRLTAKLRLKQFVTWEFQLTALPRTGLKHCFHF